MVKHHSTLGAKLIGSLAIDPDIASIILNHHENFDGTGYPNQARGEAIPLEARIIRIADTYDALTTNRAYRAAYTVKKAFQIMEREHALFDPCLLDLFLKMKYRSQMG
jgi:HD-GYP domain-containing protein (c-di-GMP phosphodiesterase class II)